MKNEVKKRARNVALLLTLTVLSACGGSNQNSVPPQQWQDTDIRVETRPSPPQRGMNEVLVLATGERGRPNYDLLVSLRTDDGDDWKQAIQDGQVGVYRRAVEFAPGARSVLQVQVSKRGGGEASVLRFPMNVEP
ncbi:MAG: hypothetical protein LBE50_04200 [Gallionellaceae bacterium]|jgi:hypothetical protein|nr:hypothetical protein [Gallionellaceae bacterium]